MRGYYFLPKFFNDEQVEWIKNHAADDDSRWTQATIFGNEGTGTVDTNVRNVDICHIGALQSPDLSKQLQWIASQVNASWFGYDIYDVYQMDLLRYSGGNGNDQFYDWHVDTDFQFKHDIARKITMIVQLSDSDDYQGGNLEFRDAFITEGHDFRQKGTVILFPSPWKHRITRVTNGLRRSLVAWVEGPPWR